ncbi:MAG: hypothetical protein OEW17_02870, partial [Gemmatimonadota bacterium]|nr:hypothetical protein [Gemmatimonadota bacterium]
MRRAAPRAGQGAGIAVGLSGTILVHAGTLLLLWASVRTIETSGPPVYAVELVAAPAPPPDAKP